MTGLSCNRIGCVLNTIACDISSFSAGLFHYSPASDVRLPNSCNFHNSQRKYDSCVVMLYMRNICFLLQPHVMQGGNYNKSNKPPKADIVCYYNSSHYPTESGILTMTLSASLHFLAHLCLMICQLCLASCFSRGAIANLVFSFRFLKIMLGALPYMTSLALFSLHI